MHFDALCVLLLWLHQDQTCQTKPCQTEPDGARRSQTESDGARQKIARFCLTSWTRRFQEFLGTDCARRHQIFLFVYLTEGTNWLVSGVPGVKEPDSNGQKNVWLRLVRPGLVRAEFGVTSPKGGIRNVFPCIILKSTVSCEALEPLKGCPTQSLSSFFTSSLTD